MAFFEMQQYAERNFIRIPNNAVELVIILKKRPLPVLLDSGLRLYVFVDIDSAFELKLDIVFSFDLYAVD